jgi:DNA-binding GntR family transcriptional regulator
LINDHSVPDALAQKDLGGSIADRVAAALRAEILAGSLAPGARLKILDLAARYRISPLPVREALRRLEGERLVVAQSHKGATVRLPDAKMISDLYEVRSALEGLLARRAALRATPASVRGLERLAARWEEAAGAGDPALMLDANRAFHDRIAELGDNLEAADAATRGWPLIAALRVQFSFSPERLAAIAAEHRALVAAIAAGDAAGAQAHSDAHVAGARRELLERLDAAGLGRARADAKERIA